MNHQRQLGLTEEKKMKEEKAEGDGREEKEGIKPEIKTTATTIATTTTDGTSADQDDTDGVVLSPEDIARFKEKGFILVERGFEKVDAQAARQILWQRLASEKGIEAGDPSTWVERTGIPECYTSGAPWNRIVTDRVRKAIDQLCGAHRWRPFGLGWWVITFPNQDVPPWGPAGKWHLDGAHYHHHINSKESGLLPIFCFSNIRPGGGGTALCVGSHTVAAQILMEHEPRGLKGGQLSRMTLRRVQAMGMVVEELQAQEGDVLLTHPFLLHARSKNLGREGVTSVRFMCNPNVALKAPMQFPRGRTKLQKHVANHYDHYTPVEQAIADAVTVDTEHKIGKKRKFPGSQSCS